MRYMDYHSPIGKLLLATSEQGLCGVYFENHKHFKGNAGWQEDESAPVLQQARQQLQEYFDGLRQDFDLPLDVSAGTSFQQEVWFALRKIPYAKTSSYTALAQQIHRPKAVRAVGAANGRNPLSIIVPCHRVIASDGALTGYAGGLGNKEVLLALEKKYL